MRKNLFFAIAFIGLWPLTFAQNFKGKEIKLSIEPSPYKLTPGETLTYSAEWLGFPAGKIILSVKGIEQVSGHECYHVYAWARPNNFFRMFYDVEYKVDSYIDTKTFSTLRFEKIRRKNQVFDYSMIQFDREKNEATYSSCHPQGPIDKINFASLSKDLAANNPKTVKTASLTQDPLSSVYYFRLLDIKENNVYSINISFDQKDWPVKVKVGKLLLKEIRKKGIFSVFEFSAEAGMLNFVGGTGKSMVYFTTDSKRIPLSFATNTKFGPIKGLIQDLPK